MSVGLGRAVFNDGGRRGCEKSGFIDERFGTLGYRREIFGCEGCGERMEWESCGWIWWWRNWGNGRRFRHCVRWGLLSDQIDEEISRRCSRGCISDAIGSTEACLKDWWCSLQKFQKCECLEASPRWDTKSSLAASLSISNLHHHASMRRSPLRHVDMQIK